MIFQDSCFTPGRARSVLWLWSVVYDEFQRPKDRIVGIHQTVTVRLGLC